MKDVDANAEYIAYLIQTQLKSDISGSTEYDRLGILFRMQEQIYSVLLRRQQLFGVEIPEIWLRWKDARGRNTTEAPVAGISEI